MFQQIKGFFDRSDEQEVVVNGFIDENLAMAALMVNVIVADGLVKPEEMTRFKAMMCDHYDLSDTQADELIVAAKSAHSEAVSLRGFTNILKSKMSDVQILSLLEHLWEIVYADNQMHEHEDTVMWRVADLLGVSEQVRLALQKKVLARLG